MAENNNHKAAAVWAAVGKLVVPFLIGIASTAFFLGGRSQKNASSIQEVLIWKAEVTATLARMDKQGTFAGEHFGQAETKELGRIEERLKELEKEAKSIEAMKLKIEGLERAQLDRTGRAPAPRP